MPQHFCYQINKEGKSPKEIFNSTHEELVKKGGEWLNKTSESCSVVSALIATVAFAASASISQETSMKKVGYQTSKTNQSSLSLPSPHSLPCASPSLPCSLFLPSSLLGMNKKIFEGTCLRNFWLALSFSLFLSIKKCPAQKETNIDVNQMNGFFIPQLLYPPIHNQIKKK